MKRASIVHWGDLYMACKKGRPLVHTHNLCGKDFDPVMVCSECGEPLSPRQVHVYPGPGPSAKDPRHLPLQTDFAGARRIAKKKAASRGGYAVLLGVLAATAAR
jgi:hypothetical protein